MKVKVYSPEEVDDNEVYVRLGIDPNGNGVDLLIVDEEGDVIWSIAKLGNDGQLHLYPSIEDENIKTDSSGYIKIVKDE